MHDRIIALLALAQHPKTPRAEAESALAMASKLMQKYGITESDLGSVPDDRGEVVIERVKVGGRYRVRRVQVLWAIGRVHCCAGYRDDDEDGQCVQVMYGRASDIFAARTLFAAADALGARLLPRGDRSARVSWWLGFQHGIEEALKSARSEFIAETPGVGLVLADRMERAEAEKRATAPPLRKEYSYIDSSSAAFHSGVSAGRGFGASGRSFGSGTRGELG